MGRFRTRGQRWGLGASVAALLAGLFLFWIGPMLAREVHARIEAAALRHGVVVRIDATRVGIWPLLRLEGLDLDLGHGLRLRADTVAVTWPGQLRIAVRGAGFTGPAGITLGAAATDWKASGLFGDAPQLTLVGPQPGLTLGRRTVPDGTDWTIDLRGLAFGRLFDVRREALPLFDGGTVDGHVELGSDRDGLHFRVDIGAQGVRMGALAGNTSDDPQLGEPTDLGLRFAGTWLRKAGRLDVPEFHATLAGAALAGSLALSELDSDPAIDLVLGVKRLDFAQLLGTSGLDVPEGLGKGAAGSHDLGSVAIDLRVRGRLAEPGTLTVGQTIDFTPPRELPPGITRLRGDFDFTPSSGTGRNRSLQVSPESPDFIALHDVPPLFLRTLLLAEDSAFYGHRGIDLREMPNALVTNWSRGGAARGASTITQQLAKNLFLSRDKQVGRKLQELAITFLLESALGKARILEIYLNIIEWGPELRGLRPAARHYFGREPGSLTPAQMAFLVSIIPGPILYQRSLVDGRPGPGLRVLVDNLLAKLRSVDAISEEEYRLALADPLSLEP